VIKLFFISQRLSAFAVTGSKNIACC